MSDAVARALLRHAIAVVAYRAEKVLRDAPTGFGAFRAGPHARNANEILAHMGDLFVWALWLSQGQHIWNDAKPLPWDAEVARFFTAIERFDDYVASVEDLQCGEERLFQGPLRTRSPTSASWPCCAHSPGPRSRVRTTSRPISLAAAWGGSRRSSDSNSIRLPLPGLRSDELAASHQH